MAKGTTYPCELCGGRHKLEEFCPLPDHVLARREAGRQSAETRAANGPLWNGPSQDQQLAHGFAYMLAAREGPDAFDYPYWRT